jgi:hypothetical protein
MERMMSTIYQIKQNLETTIAGKEAYLADIEQNFALASMGEDLALVATAEFLKININELKVILHDVNKACEEHSLMSWEINPERMGQ